MRIAATLIDGIVRSDVTEDGRHLALTLAETGAGEITLGLRCDQLPELIDRCARALADSERVLRRGEDARIQWDATWWTLHPDRPTGGFVLSLTFGSSGQLSFALSPHMAAALRDNLTAHLDPAEPAERGFGTSDRRVETC